MLPSIKTICAFIAIASLALAGCSSGDSGSNTFDKWQMNSYPQVAGNDIAGYWLLINTAELGGNSVSGSDIFIADIHTEVKFRELIKITQADQGYLFSSCDPQMPQLFSLDSEGNSSVLNYFGADITVRVSENHASAVMTTISEQAQSMSVNQGVFTSFISPFFAPALEDGTVPPFKGRQFSLRKVSSIDGAFGSFSVQAYPQLSATGNIDCFRERHFISGIEHEMRIEVADFQNDAVSYLSVFQWDRESVGLERAGILYQRTGDEPETASFGWFSDMGAAEPYIDISISETSPDVEASMLLFVPLAEAVIDFAW